MVIDLNDVLEVPVRDVHALGEHLVRFRFATPRPVSPYHQLLLEGGRDTRGLFPGAPNREGIQYNFDNIRAQLARVFEANRDCEPFAAMEIDSLEAFARLNVEHFCQPQFAYTNGQALVSVTSKEVPDGWIFLVAQHPSISDYLSFSSDYGPYLMLNPENLGLFASLEAAEVRLHRELSQLEVRSVTLMRGEERRGLLLQPCGSRYDKAKGRRVETFLLSHAGGVQKVRSEDEPYAFLNALELDGFRVRTCATCAHFRFSGMSRDMSGGSKGYCEPRREAAERRARERGERLRGMDTNPRLETVVSVFDVCDAHTFIEDRERKHPYLRSP